MIGTKEWYGGDIEQADGMYAYSDVSNILLVMVRRKGSGDGREYEGETMGDGRR